MTLAQPWWLLLGLLVGVLFYLHRQRRAARAALVGNLHLWKRVAVQSNPQANPLPRWTPALLLQLLALLLVALALARPTLSQQGGGGTLILLESSRAMSARVSSASQTTRFQAAVAQAAGQLGSPVTVLEVGDLTWPLAVERRDLAAVRRTLRELSPTDGVADWESAARFARSLWAGKQGVKVIALTSPSGATAAGTALKSLQPEVLTLGDALPNAAITSFSVQPGQGQEPWVMRGTVRAYGQTGNRSLNVTLGRQTLKTLPLALKDGQDTPFTLKFTPGAGGVLQATLTPADALPRDDQAQWVLSPTPKALRALLVAESAQPNPNDPVERGLSSLPGIQLTHADTLPSNTADLDLLVVTRPGVALPTTPLAPVTLWLNASTRPVQNDAPLAWNDADLLSSGINWADLRVASSAPVTPWADGTALLSGERGPLIEARGQDGQTEVRVNFPLGASNWPSLPDFPIFLGHLAQRAAPRAGQQVSACTVGLPCALPPQTKVLKGEGIEIASPGLSFVPKRAGVYQVDGEPLAVGRLAGAEADLRVAAPSGSKALSASRPTFTLLERMWRPLLALALLAVLLELLLFWRAEPLLRRGLGAARSPTLRRMLALHALAASLLLLAVLNVPLPGRGRSAWQALLLPPGAAPPVGGRADFTLWGGDPPSPSKTSDQTPTGDLALALATAAAAIPADAAGTLSVSGTTWPTSALLPDVLAHLGQGGVRVNVSSSPAQLAVQAVSVPETVSVGETFALQAVFSSPSATTAELQLRRGDTELLRQKVPFRAGFNRLALPLRETEPGLAGYTLTLTAAQDRVSAQAATRVQGDGGVLLVTSDAAEGAAVERALKVQGIAARRVTPETLNAAALSSEGLNGVERLALLNVPARALRADTRAALDALVRGGAHLYLGGGSATFGPGGYVGTALETLSPLSGRVTRDVPRLGLALVVDKSGSMNELVGQGFSKLDLIKVAALNSALLLSPQSDVTVIAFDSAPKLAVPLTQVTPANQAQIRAQIGRIEAEGGTVVKRALDAALKELSKSSAAQRHIILLTDGIDGGIFSPDEYERQIRRIHATGITVSTVSVGSGMHIPLMRNIAQWGGGKFSLTHDWRDVPALLAQDTLDQGQTAVKTGQFPARWGAGSGTLRGYVQTSLKPGATLVASVNSGGTADPLAATWRVGLGSVSALATQTAGGWTGTLAAQDAYPAWLAPLLRGESSAGPTGEALTLERQGADLVLTAHQSTVTLRGPVTRTLHLNPDGTGRYSAQVYAPPAGGYAVGTASETSAVGINPAPNQAALLRQVAQQMGGLVDGQANSNQQRPVSGWGWQPGWPTFALLALAAFFAGLALRYLGDKKS